MNKLSSILMCSVLLLTGSIAACSGNTGGTDNTGGGGNSSISSSSGTGGIGGIDTGAVVPRSAPECANAGGICVGMGMCAQAKGTIAATSPGGCDGLGECCIPPAPMPNPTTCAEAGGICTGVSACLQSGYFAKMNAGCDNHDIPCCVPWTQCGPEIVECCTDTASFHPSCDKGEFTCVQGSLMYSGTCKF